MSNAAKYEQIFEYLSMANVPTSPEPAVVFGRGDQLVAHALGDIVIPSLVTVAVITGGVGKDTRDLLRQGYRSEAHFLEDKLHEDANARGYTAPRIMLDEKATNGGQNARNSVGLLIANGIAVSSVTAVAHATSSRRLAETLRFVIVNKTGQQPIIHTKPSACTFDPKNLHHTEEAAVELLRLADWPAKGLLGEQPDLPEDLVQFARDVYGASPKPVSPWQEAILRCLPKSVQLRAIEFAAKHSRK